MLPVLFHPPQHVRAEQSALQAQLAQVSGELHFTARTMDMVDNDELERFWRLLEDAAAPSGPESLSQQPAHRAHCAPDVPSLDYMRFKQCGDAVRQRLPRLAPFFAPWVLMSLRRDAGGCIAVNTLFDLVMRKMSLQQTRLSLCLADPAATGLIREKDLEAFVLEQIGAMPQLATLDDGFHAVYAVYAARKFFFFLDLRRTGRVPIAELLCSDVLAEFNELLQPRMSDHAARSNWFSVPFVTRVHSAYIQMDENQNGLLSRAELARIDGGFLTSFVRALAFLPGLPHCSSPTGSLRSASHTAARLTTRSIWTSCWRRSIREPRRCPPHYATPSLTPAVRCILLPAARH